MADFFDTLNQQLQQRAMQGHTFDWDNYSKLERVQQLADKRKKQPQSNGNFLTSLIPTGGGVAGSLAGGAAGAGIGTALLPGIGTALGGLLGAIAGGAGGSALGKVGENAVEGEKDLSKGVGQEALMGGLTSLPVGAGFKLAGAGAKLATGLGKKTASELVTEAAQKTVPTFAKGAQERLASAVPGEVVGDTTLKTSAAGRATDLGNKALTSQYGTISKPIARATNPEQTFSELADAGILKPADVERLAGEITGSNGIVNRAVVKSVGKAGGVDTSTLRQVFNDALDNYGVNESDRKALTSTFDAQMQKLNGGEKGTLKPLANPNDALGVMKSIESRIANLTGKGGNYRLTTPERTDQANVLKLVRDELQDKLYQGAGANSKLSDVLTPEFRQQLVSLHPDNPQWAQYVDKNIMGAKSIGDLRAAQRPFVNASKIINEADINGSTFGGRVGNGFNQGGIKDTILNAGTDLVKNPAARLTARTLRAAGGKTAGRAPGQTVQGAAFRQSAGRGLAGALEGGSPDQQSVDANGLAPEDYQTLASEGIDPTTLANPGVQPGTAVDGGAGGSSNPFGVSKDQVASAMVQALAAGDTKNFENFKALYDVIDSADQAQAKQAGTTGYGKPSAQQYALAQSGLDALGQLTDLIGQNPDIIGRAGAVPGQNLPIVGGLISNAAGTGDYNALSQNVIDAIARARTGAAMTANEEAFYRRMLPQPGDNEQTIQTKLAQLQQALTPFIPQPGQSSGLTLNDVLSGAA